MKKIVLSVIVLSTTILFLGCGNNIVKKSMENVNLAMENREYDEAIMSLETVLDKEKNNEEANKLYMIVKSYKEANNAMKNKDIKKTKNIINSINLEYVNYPIKDDVDRIKKEVENYYNEIDKIDRNLVEAEKLFKNNRYDECNKYLLDNIKDENKYVTEEQRKKVLELINKCKEEKNRMEEEQKRIEEEKRKMEEERKKAEEKVYTREEVAEYFAKEIDADRKDYIVIPQYADQDRFYNGELCYQLLSYNNSTLKGNLHYIGSKTLNRYNFDEVYQE